MKPILTTLIVCCLILTHVFVYAQEQCGAQLSSAEAAFLLSQQAAVQALDMSVARAMVQVPIKAHIVRNSNATGGLSMADLNSAIANANNYFANASMQFVLCGDVQYIDNTALYDFNSATENEALTTGVNITPNTINIYFANTLVIDGQPVQGFSHFPTAVGMGTPDRDVIFMQNSITADGKILSHELGHYFGLLHTHESYFGYENASDHMPCRNCETTGDLLCDTPADPYLFCGTSVVNCGYQGNASDECGPNAYEPDTHNIMSYTCNTCRDMFTDGQIGRIWSFYEISRHYLTCPDDCVVDINITSPVNNTLNLECSNQITASSSVNVAANYVLFDAGQSITLNPGFRTNVTSGEFRAFIQGCSVGGGGSQKTEAPAINQRQTFDSTIKVSPNPFHTTANISYNLDSDAPVSLTVFDATGRLVSTLVNNQTQSAGTYSHEFDGSNLAAGMYICHLQTGDKVQVQKIMLTR